MDVLLELEKRIDRALAEITKLRSEKDELKKLVKELERQNKEMREKADQSETLAEAAQSSQAKMDDAARHIEQIILKLDKAF
jgi:hypothetical protein